MVMTSAEAPPPHLYTELQPQTRTTTVQGPCGTGARPKFCFINTEGTRKRFNSSTVNNNRDKMRSEEKRLNWIMICVLLLLLIQSVSGTYPTAQDVTWVSSNFKTLLTWRPKPTNYSYTVEFSLRGENRQRLPLCIRTNDTECDLTAGLKDLKGSYNADVLSEPMRGETSDLVEFPHSTSSWFCPYKDTNISRPDFKIEVNNGERKMTLYVTDIATAVFNEQKKRLTIREIFKNDLQYKVIYRKAKSSGQKEKFSTSSVIELTDLDPGQSYCFTVQAYIPSRTTGKQLGDISNVKCSPEGDTSFLEEYSLAVIAAAILSILVLVAVAIAVAVICCKRRQKAKRKEKEGVPLRGV